MNDTASDALSKGEPRYQQIAALLQDRIAVGEYKVGTVMPTEQEICTEFSISRHTAREALRRLTALGLVRRRQGSGTEVIASTPPAVYRHSMRSLRELLEYAADTRILFEPAARVVPVPADLQRVSKRGKWNSFQGVRLTLAGAPICFTRIWMPAAFAAIADELPTAHGPIYELIERRFRRRVVEVVQDFTAEPMGEEAAEALGRDVGAPSVRVVRQYLGAGEQPLIIAASWHPSETFAYTMRLRREETGPDA
ncbi:GntR family transcriptional regulator [Acuticoccus sediminis]|uniref:GntR family transcriptional regulator n=1 Tax=Acuticoccus sediminis TaxID=2184697 RepID=UPI001CFF4B00|nr:GntR family transcriptional regulator [Acuticoccus sediminis]